MTWEDVPGWFDWMQLYDEVALTTPPYSTIVEVGVAFGRSLIYLAQRLKHIGRPGVKLIAVDPWVDYDEHHFIYHPETATNDYERQCAAIASKYGGIYEAFFDYLHESGCRDLVEVMRMPSLQAAEHLRARSIKPHFVFIDGSHHQPDVAADLDAWWSLGPEWIAGHDYNPDDEKNFPGVWRAVDAKFGRANVEWGGQPAGANGEHTCFIVRRYNLERPR